MSDELESLKPAERMCAELEEQLKMKGIPVPTVQESCEQALREHMAAMALKSLGQKSPTSAEGIRIALDNAWHRLSKLKADPSGHKTTPELLADIASGLNELESQAKSYLDWRVNPEENVDAQFNTLRTFASALVNTLRRESESLVAALRRVVDEDQVDREPVILILECQVINFNLLSYLLTSTIDQMPYYPDPKLPH
jgi:hypothetical protein